MKRKLSFAVLAALGAFVLVLLSGVPLPYPAHAQASPSVAVSLSSDTVEKGAAITVTMRFGGLESDADTATKDYVFRADVVGADGCEDQAGGYGLGVDRYMWQVDQDPETRTGSVSADCPAGDYTVEAVLNAPDGTRLASARASFTVTAPAPTPEPTPEPAPLVAIALFPSSSVEQGTAIAVTMGFIGLQSNWDTDTTDYIFRADVVDADECEGDGLGVDRYMHQVDEDPETRTGTISADCPAGDYTLEASISSPDRVELASARASFSVAEPEEEEDGPPDSAQQQTTPIDITLDSQNGTPRGVWSDGTTIWVVDNQRHKLYAYTLSGGARDSGKDITLDGANRNPTGVWSDGTTIWVADRSDGKLYAYTLSGGARDSGKDFGLASKPSDGTFAADDNGAPAGIWSDGTTIWVEDSTDDKLYAYTLSNGSRDSAKEFSVRQGAETPAGIWADGTTVWVVYAGHNKALAYTISGGSRNTGLDLSLRISSSNWGAWSDGTTMWVVNGGAGNQKLFHHSLPGTSSTDAALRDLSVSAGTLTPAFAADTTSYTASVANSVTSITVTATKNDAAATVVITPADADANAAGDQVSLDVGSNVVTVTVTAEDGTTIRTYTVTVTRATAPPASATPVDITLPSQNGSPRGIWSDGTTVWVVDPTDDKIYAYALADGARQANKEFDLHSDNSSSQASWSNGSTVWVVDFDDRKLYAYALADGARQASKDIALNSDNSVPPGIWSNGSTIWVADTSDDKLYAYALADGARQANREFDLHSDNSRPYGIWSDGSTVWVGDYRDHKLYAYALAGGARQAGKDIALNSDNEHSRGVWSNGSTIWVADTSDEKLYAYALPKPPTLTGLTVSAGTLTPAFASDLLEYTVPDVPNADSRITVTATPETGATVAYEDGSGNTLTDADSTTAGDQFDLAVGQNTITIKVTEDSLSRTYTVTVTRAAPAASSDASLSGLSLSSGTLTPAFAGATTSYAASVANSVSWTTVTATKNHAAASVLITPTDADANRAGDQVNLDVGSNTVTVKVTAEDGAATRTYTVTVTRATAPAAQTDITLHSDNSAAYGIWSDGTTIWVVDVDDDKLYAYALADGTRLSSKEFDLHGDNGNPRGIWSDGTTIWVADDDDKLYAYALADGTRQDGSVGTTNKEFDLSNDHLTPQGMWSNGSTIWVVNDSNDNLYAYGLTGTRQDVRDIDLDRDNHTPTGIWSDGDTIWVANFTAGLDTKLYAHDLHRGTRRANLDLDLDSSNDVPQGIWSDGDTVWVADIAADKLYAYALPKQPAVSVRAMAPQIVYEPQGGVIVAVRVRTDSYEQPQGSLTLTVQSFPDTAHEGTDYLPFTATTVTFNPDDFFGYYDSGFFEAIKHVARFRIVDDNTPEGDEQLIISVSTAASSASTATTQGAIVTIEDGDVVPYRVD